MRPFATFTTMLLLCACLGNSAFAGETSIYSKIGVMDWVEHADGKQFVRETGTTQEIGIEHHADLGGADIELSAGTWLAQLYYDGVKLETMEPYKTVSGDFGLKGYAGASVPVPVTDKLTVATMAGLSLNSFIRFVPGELWLVLGAKTGLIAKYEKYELKAGIQYPFFTSDTVNLTSQGVHDLVTTRPKGQISPFCEFNIKINDSWKVGGYFEMWRWAASDEETYRYTGNNPGSVLAKNNSLYQPDTTVLNTGISIDYRF